MARMSFRERFRGRFYGKQLWKTINFMIFVALYGTTLIVPMIAPLLFWDLLTYIGFALLLYLVFWQNYLRRMDKSRRGKQIMRDWIDHELGLGEEYWFLIDDIQPIERLPKDELKAVDEFVDLVIIKEKAEKTVRPDMSAIEAEIEAKQLEKIKKLEAEIEKLKELEDKRALKKEKKLENKINEEVLTDEKKV